MKSGIYINIIYFNTWYIILNNLALLMLWALFLVNISFTSCDDKNPEVQIGELTPQKLYQTSWRGTGRCDAWVVPNMGVGMQFIDTQSGKVNWEVTMKLILLTK